MKTQRRGAGLIFILVNAETDYIVMALLDDLALIL